MPGAPCLPLMERPVNFGDKLILTTYVVVVVVRLFVWCGVCRPRVDALYHAALLSFGGVSVCAKGILNLVVRSVGERRVKQNRWQTEGGMLMLVFRGDLETSMLLYLVRTDHVRGRVWPKKKAASSPRPT